jgi:hypothetical protein
MSYQVFSLSTQFIAAKVTGIIPNNTVPDLSLSPVYFCFLAQGAVPVENTNWTAGSWATDTANTAQLLVGPSGHQLSTGTYDAWIRISVPPQEPIIKIGSVTVY